MNARVHIQAVGVIGPGAGNWQEWAALLQAEASYVRNATVVPALNALPAAERRRTGAGVKLALACGMEALQNAGVAPAEVTTVFCSSGGDGENCHMICQALAGSDRLISPTRFHNSVHNAPSGYWGIASGAMLPSTSLCAYDGGFAVGLLEAAVQVAVEQRPVLLVVYDTPYPEPLHATRPLADQFAVAMLLTPQAAANGLGSIALALDDAAQTAMQHADLETVRRGIPAARSLPLLRALATRRQEDVQLEYVNGRTLRVAYAPA
ncbi:hypothetical protein GCM10007205_15590 [Oxalicibacterium flavum]|uniref:Beta-ketoacyl synthase-like N-terminal domain-containing protein n=1 Tax=Oxalicibacterium flavum TaxID=179467 RepID=A0A8J2UNQ5_9BURK|nr:beta-ketoacyl synthase chain length factor [Oxalicibacterium flavum]GGC07316.1 hypothetical protein GCM10007205_15590 [Oxalicibacterium flavum]